MIVWEYQTQKVQNKETTAKSQQQKDKVNLEDSSIKKLPVLQPTVKS